MNLEIRGLYKKFGSVTLFSDFNIAFPKNTITCILGPSGCGKTTLLNIIGNIIRPDSGVFSGFEGKTISYIFQDPRLVPWKTTEENIRFVLSSDLSQERQKEITGDLIRLVELEDFAGFYPSKLSGGMRQRVSIARAFAFPSDIILMDEPLKGLDIKLKLNLIRTFSHIWQTDKRTVIFVTHDVDEALLLGNEIVVLSQIPAEILTREKIDGPAINRSPDTDDFKELKRRLMEALGN